MSTYSIIILLIRNKKENMFCIFNAEWFLILMTLLEVLTIPIKTHDVYINKMNLYGRENESCIHSLRQPL